MNSQGCLCGMLVLMLLNCAGIALAKKRSPIYPILSFSPRRGEHHPPGPVQLRLQLAAACEAIKLEVVVSQDMGTVKQAQKLKMKRNSKNPNKWKANSKVDLVLGKACYTVAAKLNNCGRTMLKTDPICFEVIEEDTSLTLATTITTSSFDVTDTSTTLPTTKLEETTATTATAAPYTPQPATHRIQALYPMDGSVLPSDKLVRFEFVHRAGEGVKKARAQIFVGDTKQIFKLKRRGNTRKWKVLLQLEPGPVCYSMRIEFRRGPRRREETEKLCFTVEESSEAMVTTTWMQGSETTSPIIMATESLATTGATDTSNEQSTTTTTTLSTTASIRTESTSTMTFSTTNSVKESMQELPPVTPLCEAMDPENFNLCIEIFDLSSGQLQIDQVEEDFQNAFLDAKQTWERVMDGDDGVTHNTFTGTQVDDIYIAAEAGQIDGPGGVLGFAGPTEFWTDNHGRTRVFAGAAVFDAPDLKFLVDRRLLASVIVHEVGHVLGLGSLWPVNGLFDYLTYKGENANREYRKILALKGPVDGDETVPIELDGNTGTRYGHWDEGCLTEEIATGWLNYNTYFSKITVGGLADLGYSVDYDNADPFAISNYTLCRSLSRTEPNTQGRKILSEMEHENRNVRQNRRNGGKAIRWRMLHGTRGEEPGPTALKAATEAGESFLKSHYHQQSLEDIIEVLWQDDFDNIFSIPVSLNGKVDSFR